MKDKDIIKSILIGILTVNIISLVLLVCLWITPIKNNEFCISEEEVSSMVTLEGAGFNKLTMDKYLELIKSSEKSIILVARPTCGYCEKFSPILKEAADDMNLTVNYVNTDEFTNEDWNTFTNSLEYLAKNALIMASQILFIVKSFTSPSLFTTRNIFFLHKIYASSFASDTLRVIFL